jgi:hypothetical protein
MGRISCKPWCNIWRSLQRISRDSLLSSGPATYLWCPLLPKSAKKRGSEAYVPVVKIITFAGWLVRNTSSKFHEKSTTVYSVTLGQWHKKQTGREMASRMAHRLQMWPSYFNALSSLSVLFYFANLVRKYKIGQFFCLGSENKFQSFNIELHVNFLSVHPSVFEFLTTTP